jgi:hypothetical protein
MIDAAATPLGFLKRELYGKFFLRFFGHLRLLHDLLLAAFLLVPLPFVAHHAPPF